MSETKSEKNSGQRAPTSSAQIGELVTSQGRTTIADSVVGKVVGIAAREVSGVYAMGGGAARAFGAVRDRIPGGTTASGAARGVTVEVGESQAAVDIDLVVEYGVSIPDLAAGVRRNVIESVEHVCGLEVTEVNVNIGDIHMPGEDDDDPTQESRVA